MAFDEEKETFERVETDQIITKGHKNETSIFLENLQDVLGLNIRDGYDTVKERIDSYIKKYVRSIEATCSIGANETLYGKGSVWSTGKDVRNELICESGVITRLCAREWSQIAEGSEVRIEVMKNGETTGLYMVLDSGSWWTPSVKESPTVEVSLYDKINFKAVELGGVIPGPYINISAKIESV